MSTNPVTNNPPNTTTSNQRTTADAQKGLNASYQDFLKLLTVQLTNQDPTAPMDPAAMVSQLAQLSQVEQQISSNSKLDQLLAMLGTTQANNAISYIGKQIDATGNQIDLNDGKAALVYTLPPGAVSANVSITNSAGQVVFTGTAPKAAGRNQVVWNGVNSTSGQTMPDGAYKFTVTAKDAANKALTATTFTTGTVTAVDTKDGVNSLSIGSISVPLSSVQSVYTSGTNPGA